VLNSPIVLTGILPLKLLMFLPALLWINIPTNWLGLGLIGEPHYKTEEFGAMPQTPLSWIMILVFWIIISALLAFIPIGEKGNTEPVN
jgi:hypothetical protein